MHIRSTLFHLTAGFDFPMIEKRKVFLWAALVALLLLIAWGFMPQPVGVDVRPVVRGALAVAVTEEGKTRVIDRYVVSAPIAGYARRVELDVGDTVSAGQSLVHLDPMRSSTLDPRSQAEAEAAASAAQAALNAATEGVEASRAEAELARNEYERIRTVAEQGLISKGELDAARARWRSTEARHRSAEFNVEVARGELEAARAAVDLSAVAPNGSGEHVSVTIKSPVDGTVSQIHVQDRQAVEKGEKLITIG